MVEDVGLIVVVVILVIALVLILNGGVVSEEAFDNANSATVATAVFGGSGAETNLLRGWNELRAVCARSHMCEGWGSGCEESMDWVK